MKMEIKNWFIIAGIFIAAFFTAYQYYTGVQSSKENKELSKKLLEKTTQLADANKENAVLQKRINNNTIKIIESNNALIKAQDKTIKQITGDGYPWFEVNYIGKFNYELLLCSNKDFPVYDIDLTVINMDKCILCERYIEGNSLIIDRDCYWGSTKIMGKTVNLPAGNNNHNTGIILNFTPGLNHYEYLVSSRNMNTLHRYVVKYHPAGYFQGFSYRVYMVSDKYYLLEEKENGLSVSEEHWESHFFPYANRRDVPIEDYKKFKNIK